ncbi:hypothetical protein B0H17DRAFT_1177680 [Mycena rosella]|uniref:Uncharacterized protein n=1 Tax=Mycena rosella TaxID=1033263 RepID=A0AAD7DQP3_MYCRO|nr:hypothetical protein B0H17DRAFT_1177680 [Mycena rosella]
MALESINFYIDLESNKDSLFPMGPFDGRHEVAQRADYRYGRDDPPCCPQMYSDRSPHFAAIPKRAARPNIEIMWYEPTRRDFDKGTSLASHLGRLAWRPFQQFLEPINRLSKRVRQYQATQREGTTVVFTQLHETMTLALERVQTVPATYEWMCFEVASIQRCYLELKALLDYTTMYHRKILEFKPFEPFSPAEPLVGCMGVFTNVLSVAQLLYKAGLSYWLIRPTQLFDRDIVRKTVKIDKPLEELGFPDGEDRPVVYSGHNTADKMQAIWMATRHMPWYRDVFNSDQDPNPNSVPVPQASHPGPSAAAEGSGASSRYSPYPVQAVTRPGKKGEPRGTPFSCGGRGGGSSSRGNGRGGGARGESQKMLAHKSRDKFQLWAAPEMPLDPRMSPQTGPNDRKYIAPELALLVSSEHASKHQRLIHHWMLLRSAFVALIGDGPSSALLLFSQEWPDILDGKIEARGHPQSRTGKCSRSLVKLITPVFALGNLQDLGGLPVPDEQIPHYYVEEMQEIAWDVAEINFHFELAGLDRRASGRERWNKVRKCFVGKTLLPVLDNASAGLGHISLEERHQYNVCIAELMVDWQAPSGRPPLIDRVVARHEEDSPVSEMEALEKAVAQYYSQSFYDLFGRVAVIPMCLDSPSEPRVNHREHV